jgi:hypothetical protein
MKDLELRKLLKAVCSGQDLEVRLSDGSWALVSNRLSIPDLMDYIKVEHCENFRVKGTSKSL